MSVSANFSFFRQNFRKGAGTTKKDISRKLFSILFFAGVFALMLWYVFHDENLSQIVDFVGTADPRYVFPSVALVIAFILGESVVICYLLRALGSRTPFGHCCLYSFIGFFYSAITPSASGGQPMQVVAMRRDGISSAVSAVVLAIVTITYKLVLVLTGLAVLLIRPAAIMVYLDEVESLMYLGLGLNVAFIVLLLLAVFHPGTIRGAFRLLLHIANRIRPFRNPERANARVENFIGQYSGAAFFLRNNPRIILHVFLITVVQRLCLFTVVWFTYQAFDLTGESAAVIILLNAMISVAVDMLPLPGGMGISESLFLAIYEPIFSEELVIPGMIISRGISYYTQLAISAVMTGFAQILFHFRRHKSAK